MNFVKNIVTIIIGVIFLMSSSGFLIYKTHCACTGDEKVSLFVLQEICKPIPNETTSSCCADKDENTCQNHNIDCDCNKPEITYFKLQNKVLNEELKYVKNYPLEILVATSIIQFNLLDSKDEPETILQFIDPPPIIVSSLDFLIQIHQLKLPHLA